jgi:two-component system response regulator
VSDFDGVEVLLVEDNETEADLTLRALAKCNLNNKLYWVREGAEALAFVNGTDKFEGRDLREYPRLILLDLAMPGMMGVDVLRALKSQEQTRDIPVVILTVSNQEHDLSECYRLGANGFVSKPLGFEELVDAVARIGFYWLLVNRVP